MKKLSLLFRNWFVKVYIVVAELLYHTFAWAYDGVAWLVSFGYWSRWRLDALQYVIPGAILETGFGTGTLLIEMTESGMDVTGLELSAQMQRVTGRKLKRRDVAVKRVLGRVERLPFPARKFMNILSTFPSNYIFDEETCKEVHRVLDKSGRWVILGLEGYFKSGIKKWLTKWLWGDWDERMVQHLVDKINRVGFSYSVVRHETEQYVLPVLILERHDA